MHACVQPLSHCYSSCVRALGRSAIRVAFRSKQKTSRQSFDAREVSLCKMVGGFDGVKLGIGIWICLPGPIKIGWFGVDLILRKEVIQPQVPLRLPCYDLVPIAEVTFGACFP